MTPPRPTQEPIDRSSGYLLRRSLFCRFGDWRVFHGSPALISSVPAPPELESCDGDMIVGDRHNWGDLDHHIGTVGCSYLKSCDELLIVEFILSFQVGELLVGFLGIYRVNPAVLFELFDSDRLHRLIPCASKTCRTLLILVFRVLTICLILSCFNLAELPKV